MASFVRNLSVTLQTQAYVRHNVLFEVLHTSDLNAFKLHHIRSINETLSTTSDLNTTPRLVKYYRSKIDNLPTKVILSLYVIYSDGLIGMFPYEEYQTQFELNNSTHYIRTFSDTFTTSDTIISTKDYIRPFDDVFETSDLVANFKHYIFNLDELFTTSDSNDYSIGYTVHTYSLEETSSTSERLSTRIIIAPPSPPPGSISASYIFSVQQMINIANGVNQGTSAATILGEVDALNYLIENGYTLTNINGFGPMKELVFTK